MAESTRRRSAYECHNRAESIYDTVLNKDFMAIGVNLFRWASSQPMRSGLVGYPRPGCGLQYILCKLVESKLVRNRLCCFDRDCTRSCFCH